MIEFIFEEKWPDMKELEEEIQLAPGIKGRSAESPRGDQLRH